MTIASAFNEITENLGGTPSTSGTIAGAIDALNDTLAGSDQSAAMTIEGAIRLLGENIGGGGGSTYAIKTYRAIEDPETGDYTFEPVSKEIALMEWNEQMGEYEPGTIVTSAPAGSMVTLADSTAQVSTVLADPPVDGGRTFPRSGNLVVVPTCDIAICSTDW